MELGWCCLAIDVLIVGAFLAPIALGIIETVLGIRARKRRRVIVGGLLCASSVVLVVLVLGRPVESLRLCMQAPYLSPPATFEDEDLVGTWRAHYDNSVDTLILKADGTFKQIYEDRYDADYVYETLWNQWRVERYPDGRVRVYLRGARFYEEGTRVAEEYGYFRDWRFYDQVAEEVVTMPDTLVLNVRVDSSGQPLLLHLWSIGDEGFGLFGCERNIFRRVETP